MAIIVLVAAASFAAGWITATLQTSTPPASQGIGPTQPVGSVPAPVAPRPAGGQSASYTYSVQSNYPVDLYYVASNGDQVDLETVTTPWSLPVTTAAWGADADAAVRAYASTEKGDAFVSCTVTDASGQVVASDREDSASPWASCSVG